MKICPSVGKCLPEIAFKIVVLPAPFGPKIPVIRFFSKLHEILSAARKPFYFFVQFFNSTIINNNTQKINKKNLQSVTFFLQNFILHKEDQNAFCRE